MCDSNHPGGSCSVICYEIIPVAVTAFSFRNVRNTNTDNILFGPKYGIYTIPWLYEIPNANRVLLCIFISDLAMSLRGIASSNPDSLQHVSVTCADMAYL